MFVRIAIKYSMFKQKEMGEQATEQTNNFFSEKKKLPHFSFLLINLKFLYDDHCTVINNKNNHNIRQLKTTVNSLLQLL